MRVTCSLHSSGYTQYSELSYHYLLISLELPFDFPHLDFSSISTRFEMSSVGVGVEIFGLGIEMSRFGVETSRFGDRLFRYQI